MKNTNNVSKIRIIGIIAIVAIIGLAASCSGGGGGLSGTYVHELGISYSFSGKKMTMDANGSKTEFTYEIKDGKIFTTSEHGTGEMEYSLSGNTLTINGQPFVKK